MDSVTASTPPAVPRFPRTADLRIGVALAVSGFRRYATYRQATAAGAITNLVFGFLRCYVLLAVVSGADTATVGGYDGTQLATFVWAGQGLLAVVGLWGWTELADRIRTGEVTSDLLRPVSPVVSYLAVDLGRSAYAALTRFTPPILVGPIFFDLYLPGRWWTVPLFVASTGLAVVVCFGCRYLVNATAYWLHDARGPVTLWTLASGLLAGLYFPLHFLPEAVSDALWLATPFPGLMQTPLDVLVERDPTGRQFGIVGLQVAWAVLVLAACGFVQRRAERRLVAHGG